MFGVRCGYTGLISGDLMPLGLRDVGGIIQQGGVLGSSRCDEFKTEVGRAKALIALDRQAIKISIGVDTALNVALEAIDRLKVTASSH